MHVFVVNRYWLLLMIACAQSSQQTSQLIISTIFVNKVGNVTT
jgi:hypothetical protein